MARLRAGESAAAKAAAAASGEKAVRPEFNKRVLRDARAFANGINPTNIPEGRLARIAQSAAYRTGAVSAVRSGRALSARIAADPKKYVADARASLSKGMGTVKSVASGRAHMVADALNEARHDPRAFIGGGARNAWGAVSGAASSSYGAAKEWAGNTALGQSVYDPRGAGIGLASFAGRSAVGAVAGSYEATRKAATFVRSNPNAQAALKVARNVAIGTVLGGPVGAIVGAASAHKDIARAGGRAVGSIRESFAVRDEAKIQAYAASIESFAPRHSPEAQDGPTMQRPERSQEAPRSIAPSPQPSEPELRWDTPTDHPSQEQWALIDIENDRRQAEIVRRANEESREMSEAIKRADQMRAAQAAQAARAQTAQARPAAVQNALKSPFSAAPASVSPVQVAPARATAQRAALPSPAATPRRVVAATPKRTPRAQ